MSRKKKVIILGALVVFLFGVGITYSLLTSGARVISDQDIAKFIFNAEVLDNLNLPLVDLKPGDTQEYLFSVTNNENDDISDVTIEYQIIIKTFHLIPTTIKLYKADDTLILECDEPGYRNDKNELVCNSTIETMEYTSAELDDYKLVVLFNEEYNDIAYSELVDYLSVDIKSWQKT